ncbi:MAG: acylneuraminate cytidylyltransferase family protein [Lachnospiraceae bacterium]|nr:acylneuraminate cytidylyltransferase family protein [Lachnospiraceae bacterium]
MFNDNRIIAFIPARGGSKGIPDKNIYPLNGKPLIAYTIDAALKSVYIDDVIVSTDSNRIADISKQLGAKVPFLRPEELAGDRSNIIDAVIYTMDRLKQMGERYEMLVLLQPTQPLRRAEDIDRAVEKFYQCGRAGLVSVTEVDDHPILIRTIDSEGVLHSILNSKSTIRRQDMPLYYKVNGCIYINDVASLKEDTSFNDNPIPYIMDKDRSVDIDEIRDLYVAESIMRDSKDDECS